MVVGTVVKGGMENVITVETEEDESEEGSLDSDESEGKDWSDLEEEAAKHDRRKDAEEGTSSLHRPHQQDRHKRRSGHSSSRHGGPPMKRRK